MSTIDGGERPAVSKNVRISEPRVSFCHYQLCMPQQGMRCGVFLHDTCVWTAKRPTDFFAIMDAAAVAHKFDTCNPEHAFGHFHFKRHLQAGFGDAKKRAFESRPRKLGQRSFFCFHLTPQPSRSSTHTSKAAHQLRYPSRSS